MPTTEPSASQIEILRARASTESALTEALFASFLKVHEPLETFANWMLAGAAAIGAFMIPNSKNLLSVVSSEGFLVCGGMLAASGLVGLASKGFSAHCFALSELCKTTSSTIHPKVAEFESTLKEYRENHAEPLVEANLRLDKVVDDFLAPAPWWVRVFARRVACQAKSGDPYAGYALYMRTFGRLGWCIALQSGFFFLFLVAGLYYAYIASAAA